MLADAASSKAAGPEEDSKPLKKRKTASSGRQSETRSVRDQIVPSNDRRPRSPAPISNLDESDEEASEHRTLQTIEVSDESDESDMEWEDALGEGDEQGDDDDAELEVGDLSITIDGDNGKGKEPAKKARRKGITSVDKKRRLDIHKMHVLCLLYHVHRRNVWCNDGRVQAALRKLPSPKTLLNLVPNPEYTQYQASKRFIDGMNELKLLWTNRFNVTALGMHKPRWVDADSEAQAFSVFDELDVPMDRQDFRTAAATLQGSQDIGAQLFCALLRGIGVEARLVCSLQCLPFASAAQASTPQKPESGKHVVHLDPYNRTEAPSPSRSKSTPSRPKRLSRLERLIGERSPALSTGVAPKQRKKYHIAYPVYWVEALNPAHQKWVPIDPLSTFTVDKADKLEPPLNSAQNGLTYAVAFEEDLTAKDVTRRYAKAYNAKTRKFRVECTPDGTKWWKRALKPFRRTVALDRDQVEDAALARREAAEGIPKNVQDFKDHPVYVLVRHLRHNEVIHPMHQAGKVNVGSAMNPKMEPIYRRKDVHIVRSADKWYRLGRDVKDGEQPLKHAKPKKGRRLSLPPPDMDIDDQHEEIGAGLYAPFQTELYIPPPVIRGRVPRNGFGNLDLYVPSMCPMGGIHIRHKLASKAARIIGVDCADAVTGFSFKGRHGTAIIQGVVVAQEYKDAVEAVINGMEYAQEEAENSQRSAEALRMWRRFCLGLRIAQRVNAIEIDGERGDVIDVQGEIDKEDRALVEEQMAGGFFMDDRAEGAVVEPPPRPSRHYDRVIHDDEDDDIGGGFLPDGDEGGGFIPDDDGGGFIPNDDDEGGGFIPPNLTRFGSSLLEDQQLRPRRSDDFGGGFIPEDEEDEEDIPMRNSSPDHVADNRDGPIQLDGAADEPSGGFVAKDGETIDATPIDSKPDTSGLTQDLGQTMIETQQDMHTKDLLQEDSGPRVGTSEKAEAQDEPAPPSSSPSDVGSLPLEDPEDEDADPEWLVDVT
jgi:xeroderma pigmentosum group C-complementing protein